MGIVVRASTLAPVRLPLACDPSVVAANPRPASGPWALALYHATSDHRHPAAQLVVPDDACWITVRPLSRRDLQEAIGAAGDRSAADAVAWHDLRQRVVDYRAEDARSAYDRAAADLTPEQRDAARRHDRWVLEHARALTRAALVSISDLPHLLRGPAGYPVDQLQALDAPGPDAVWAWPPGLDSDTVCQEVAGHVERLSTLGKALSRSCDSPSGGPTTTPTSGSATAPDAATATSPETDPSRR